MKMRKVWRRLGSFYIKIKENSIIKDLRGVVQMARTLAWGARGRSFKSSHPDLLFSLFLKTSKFKYRY